MTLSIMQLQEWATALDSETYKQTTGTLCNTTGPTPTYCCLGVLGRELGILDSYDCVDALGRAYPGLGRELGMSGTAENNYISEIFVAKNDKQKQNFNQIAKYIWDTLIPAVEKMQA